METTTSPLVEGGDTEGSVVVLAGAEDQVCYVGYAEGLDANVDSVHANPASTQCSAANGCGTHIHSGTSCESKDTQGGHWFNGPALLEKMGSADDPWLTLGYKSTTTEGTAWFGACALTGITAKDAEDLPFIIHAEDGSRVSCGILKQAEEEDDNTGSSGFRVGGLWTLAMGVVAAWVW